MSLLIGKSAYTMENPYQPPKELPQRVFKTPIIVPLSVLLVFLSSAGYIFLFLTSKETNIFSYLVTISFEVFILCEIVIITLNIYNEKQLKNFLRENPEIHDKNNLEKLKPIIRTNMYSALFVLFFIGLGVLTGIMSILNHGFIKSIIVVILFVVASILLKWADYTEEEIKQIKCSNDSLETELHLILKCWFEKPFPNF